MQSNLSTRSYITSTNNCFEFKLSDSKMVTETKTLNIFLPYFLNTIIFLSEKKNNTLTKLHENIQI